MLNPPGDRLLRDRRSVSRYHPRGYTPFRGAKSTLSRDGRGTTFTKWVILVSPVMERTVLVGGEAHSMECSLPWVLNLSVIIGKLSDKLRFCKTTIWSLQNEIVKKDRKAGYLLETKEIDTWEQCISRDWSLMADRSWGKIGHLARESYAS